MENNNHSTSSMIKAVSSMDNFLCCITSNTICTLCQKLFTGAITNQCGHSFCSKCIEYDQIVVDSSRYYKDTCPLCQCPIKRVCRMDNNILARIAEVCSNTPEAFKQDVSEIARNFQEIGEEFINSSRIMSIINKQKFRDIEKERKKTRKYEKSNIVNVERKASGSNNGFSTVLSSDNKKAKLNRGNQVDTEWQSCVDAEEKLKNGVPGSHDWLTDVNRSITRACALSDSEKNDKHGIFDELQDKNKTVTSVVIAKSKRTRKVTSIGKKSCFAVNDAAKNNSSICGKNFEVPSKISSGVNKDYSHSNCLKKQKMDNYCDNVTVSNLEECSDVCRTSSASLRTKMETEAVRKRNSFCRKKLDMSGEKLDMTKPVEDNLAEISSENNRKQSIPINGDSNKVIVDISSCAEIVSQFHKEDFQIPETVEMEIDGIETLTDAIHVSNETKSERENIKELENEFIATTEKTALSFLHSDKRKENNKNSGFFLKMGRLSSYLTKQDTLSFKFVFPSVSSVAVQTDDSVVQSCTTLMEGDKASVKDAGVQTTEIPSFVDEIHTWDKNKFEVNVESDLFIRPSHDEENISRKDAEPRHPDKTPTSTLSRKVENIVHNKTDAISVDVGDRLQLLDLVKERNVPASPGKPSKFREECEESDSDNFIEQTPPKGGKLPVNENSENDETAIKKKNISDCGKRKSALLKPVESVKNSIQNEKLNNSEKYGNICLVTSGIRDRTVVDAFIQKFGGRYSCVATRDMTHLVVGLHENDEAELLPLCTPKFLYAIANKKWIVTESWITKCLKSNSVLNEEEFESVDPSGGNGCYTARLSSYPLFSNYEFCLYGTFNSIPKSEFGEILENCGGIIVPNPQSFSRSPGKTRMILVDDCDSMKEEEYRDLSITHRTLIMSKDVAIISIQGYKIVNFAPFILHKFCLEDCVEWGYPPNLLIEDVNLDESHSNGDFSSEL